MTRPRLPLIKPDLIGCARDRFSESWLGGDEWVAARAGLGVQASTCLNTSVAFVPPKPNEFESAERNFTLSWRARTIGISENAGSISSIWALSQMKPFCIISNE